MDNLGYLRTYAEIDIDCIRNNIFNAKKFIKNDAGVIAVVKTDAYGHGALPVSKAVEDLVAGYAVATVDEGAELREGGISSMIIVLGYVNPCEYDKVADYNLVIPVCSVAQAEMMNEYGRNTGKILTGHIKADTGMNRIGFDCRDEAGVEKSIEEIAGLFSLNDIKLPGIFMHFATADMLDKTYAIAQHERFMNVLRGLEKRGIIFKYRHCSNSAAVSELPDFTLDLVRQGITLYGLTPGDEFDSSVTKLEPAMSIRTHVGFVKTVKAGQGIGYGQTFVAPRDMRVATVCIGYGDGYPRTLSNIGHVLIKGMKAPILGRVCMDQMMVDVSGIEDVKEGDLVTVLGRDGDQFISAEVLGELSKRFNYEFVCEINKRVTRVYKYGEKYFLN